MARLLINLDVADLERALAFYVAAFELEVGRRLGDFGVELLGAEAPLYLLVKPPGSPPFDGAQSGRDYARHWTPVHLDFVVSDLDAARQRVEAAGAQREGDVSHANWGSLARFSDPFGNGFCLVQFSPAGYDAI